MLNVLQSAQPARFPDLISTYFYLSIDHPFAAPALTAFDLHQLGWMKRAQALPIQTDKSWGIESDWMSIEKCCTNGIWWPPTLGTQHSSDIVTPAPLTLELMPEILHTVYITLYKSSTRTIFLHCLRLLCGARVKKHHFSATQHHAKLQPVTGGEGEDGGILSGKSLWITLTCQELNTHHFSPLSSTLVWC